MSPAVLIVVVRYLVVLAMGALVHKGVITALPGNDVLDAVAQIATGGVVTAGLMCWAMLRSTKAAVLKRVAGMHDVSTIHAEPALAAAMQAQGVTNVVPTPPAAP